MCAYLYCCTASACKADGLEIVHVYEAYREQRDADRKDCKERARGDIDTASTAQACDAATAAAATMGL
jgi:hypothetical protein